MSWLRSFPLILIVAVPISPAPAAETKPATDDWPQWLGPHRDASSPEKVAAWKGKLKVMWRKKVGAGHSSPIVAGGKVFLFTKVKDKDAEQVTAYDAGKGDVLWSKEYPRAAFFSIFGTGPQATPAVVAGKVYTFGITGVLSCFDAADGKKRWQVDTLKQFKVQNLRFGEANSPLVVGDKVFVMVGGKGSTVVAFKKDDGTTAWKALDGGASYASPLATKQDGKQEVIFFTGAGLAALAPADGKVFWKFPLKDKLLESSATPVRVGNVLLASTITRGTVGLSLETKDGKPAASEKWKNDQLTSYFTTPVAVGTKHVYIVTSKAQLAPKPEAFLHCIETATGKSLWKKGKVGTFHASLIRTGNDKLLMLTDTGDLVLIDPSPKAYRELARSKVCGQAWAHPALAGGKLYLRDEQELLCIELPK
jgi:outer membrane protein assembly factor BamB